MFTARARAYKSHVKVREKGKNVRPSPIYLREILHQNISNNHYRNCHNQVIMSPDFKQVYNRSANFFLKKKKRSRIKFHEIILSVSQVTNFQVFEAGCSLDTVQLNIGGFRRFGETFVLHINYLNLNHHLTFRHHASYIQDRRSATPQSTFFYIFSPQIYLILFLGFLSPSSFIPPQNVVYFLMLPFLVHKIFTFYINYVLNCKCPAPGPKS